MQVLPNIGPMKEGDKDTFGPQPDLGVRNAGRRSEYRDLAQMFS